MRLLTVNFALPNTDIDNQSIFNAAPWFEYPAVVVDPFGVSKVIDEACAGTDFRTGASLPVRDGTTSAGEVSIADALRRRREEAIRHLERGGVIIALAYPNALHPRVTGFTGCDRYFWLPAPPGLAYREPFLHGGDGNQVEIEDHFHPAAAVLGLNPKATTFRAYFDESSDAFREFGHVLARTPGGAVAACELRILGGRVVFLPAFELLGTGQPRFDMAKAMLTLAQKLVEGPSTDSPPAWVEEFPLPGFDEARGRLEEAGADAEAAKAEHDEAARELDELDRYRALLWAEGYPLEDAVRRSLGLLGFEIEGRPGQPATGAADGVPVVVEVEGAKGDIGHEGFRRLSRKIEDDLLATGEGKKGILAVNAHRLEPATDRAKGLSDEFIAAAEFQGFAIVPTHQLFQLTAAALAGEADVASLRNALVSTEGLFSIADLAGDPVDL